ncbi:MAG: hypothetical protein ACE5FT_07040 [Candidatus Nanoarchaeia archaeon]
MTKKKQRSIALSDGLLEEIHQVTKGAISLSAFARIALRAELEQWKLRAKRAL